MKGGWKLALRNLGRNRRRNAVTGAAIALGYAGLLLLGGYGAGMERLIRNSTVYLQHLGHVRVYARGGLVKAEAKPSAFALPRDAQEKIGAALRADPRVELWGSYLRGAGLVGNGCKSFTFVATGVELDVARRVLSHPDVVALGEDAARPRAGRRPHDAAGEESPIAVGVGLGRHRLQKSPPAVGPTSPGAPAPSAPLDCAAPDWGARVADDPYVQLAVRTHDGGFAAADARVVGWFQGATTELDRTAIEAPLDVLQRLYDTERVTYVAAFLRDHRTAPAVAAELGERLRAAGLDVTVHAFDDPAANPYYAGMMATIAGILSFMALLVTAVVMLSVLNAMTLAILERTREIGTLRSLGFTRRQVVGLLLREAAALTAISTAMGLVLALATALAVRAAAVRIEVPGLAGEVLLSLLPTPGLVAAIAVLFLALSLLATWIAVRRRVRERVAALVVEVAA